MIRNYLKIALRHIMNSKIYALINITGLSIGIACALIIMVFVAGELDYDSFHKDADRIYRVVRIMPDIHGPSTRNPMAPAMRQEFPEVEQAVRTWKLTEPPMLEAGNRKFHQSGILFASPGFFRFFTYKFIDGETADPLKDPQAAVLTRSAAEKYFGTGRAVGERLSFEGKFDLLVIAVIEDVPPDTHLQFEIVLPIERLNVISGFIYGYDGTRFRVTDNWRAGMFSTYLKLNKGVDPKSLEKKFPAFLKKYAPQNPELLDETLYLQPVKEIHLYSRYRSDRDKLSDIKYLFVIIAIGAVILLMSCFNYINLTTARISARVREIGIRRVAGARRGHLALQFLVESGLYACIGVLSAFILLEIFKPVITGILGPGAAAGHRNLLLFLGITGLIATAVFLINGSYPAVFFSRSSQGNILKDMIVPGIRGRHIRGIFVLIQFTITIALLAGTGLIYQQVSFMKSKDLGYTKEQIMIVPVREESLRTHEQTVKTELTRLPGVAAVSFSSALPSKIRPSTTIDLEIEGKRTVFEMSFASIDEDFLDVFDIDITRGRNFSREFPADRENCIILNEQAAAVLNWKDPVGRQLRIFGADKQVIGVVRDFNFQTLHTPVGPLAMRLGGAASQFASVRIRTADLPANLKNIESVFSRFMPARNFEYYFFDDYFENLYHTEENFGRTIGYLTTLAIIISALGLFGLSFFVIEKRTKEIGIRKVLGSSVPRIVTLLARDFTKWALLANLFAWPAAWIIMRRWLEEFAYRIDIGVWIFILSGILALCVALVTVGFQAVRAAAANPVKSLRYE